MNVLECCVSRKVRLVICLPLTEEVNSICHVTTISIQPLGWISRKVSDLARSQAEPLAQI